MRARFLDFSGPLPHRVVVARRRADQELFLDADISVLPADEPQAVHLGWIVYEEIGVAVINDYAVAPITITGDSTSYQPPPREQPMLYPAFEPRSRYA